MRASFTRTIMEWFGRAYVYLGGWGLGGHFPL